MIPILPIIKHGLAAVSAGLGAYRDYWKRKNAPDMQNAAKNQQNASDKDKIDKAIKAKDLDELRRLNG